MGREVKRAKGILLSFTFITVVVLFSGCLGDDVLKENYMGVGFVISLEEGEFTSQNLSQWINLSNTLGYEEETLPPDGNIYIYQLIESKETENGTFRIEIWQDGYYFIEERTDLYYFYGSIETKKFDSKDKTKFNEYEVLLLEEMDIYFYTMNWTIKREDVHINPIHEPVW